MEMRGWRKGQEGGEGAGKGKGETGFMFPTVIFCVISTLKKTDEARVLRVILPCSLPITWPLRLIFM